MSAIHPTRRRINLDVVRTLVSFLVGFVGWLTIGAVHIEGVAVYGVVLGLGLIAGTVGRWPLGPIALLVGIGASYPVALATGLIAFLGENWELYAVIFALLAVTGFAIGDLVIRGSRRGASRSE